MACGFLACDWINILAAWVKVDKDPEAAQYGVPVTGPRSSPTPHTRTAHSTGSPLNDALAIICKWSGNGLANTRVPLPNVFPIHIRLPQTSRGTIVVGNWIPEANVQYLKFRHGQTSWLITYVSFTE